MKKRQRYDVKRRVQHGAWETLPIIEQLRDVSREDHYASIYILEKALAEATEYTQNEVRKLLQQAIHEGYLVKEDELVTIAAQYQYERVSSWKE